MSRIRRTGALTIASALLLLEAWSFGQARAPVNPTRERAWRANNIGVAHLEQFDFPPAIASFRQALAADAGLAVARLNLGIALFYGGDAAAARRELEAARSSLPSDPHPDYVLGLIARADNRVDDALASFLRVREIDPADVGTAINLGQLYLQRRQYPDAIARFTQALAAEPFNATAAYGLGTVLTRSGDVGAAAAMERFQKLRSSDYAVTYSQAYLEQGKYAEGVASSGSEPELVDPATPAVKFVEIPSAIPAASGAPPRGAGGAVSLADLDGDGNLDLIDAYGSTVRWCRNDSGRFGTCRDILAGRPAFGVLAGDYDNDGSLDILVLLDDGVALMQRDAAGAFTDVTAAAGLGAAVGHPRTAAWLDADHDGDLDLVAAGDALRMFRNNGGGQFSDVSAAAGVAVNGRIVGVVPSDYDNRRDVDLLVAAADGGPRLFSNRRDGTFADVARDVALPTGPVAGAVASADINKDGFIDFFWARPGGPGQFVLSDGKGRFTTTDAPAETSGAVAGQLLDYDGDGLTDLVTLTRSGPQVLRNIGNGWSPVTAAAFGARWSVQADEALSLASGDVDGDGDVDVVVRAGATVRVWRSEGQARGASVRVNLKGRVSNRGGVGAKVEMRAGSLRSRVETVLATPAPAPADVVFGLGKRTTADAVRVLWPSGILQAETSGDAQGSALGRRLDILELDRKPSSCPFLFTWNGHRFEFVTDFLGGGEMGYWLAPGQRNTPIPEEYVRIPEGALVPRDGRLELRVTNELEEALFLDRLELMAVDHPASVSVFPNGGLRDAPEPSVLHFVTATGPVAAAIDHRGSSVTDRLASADRRYVDDLPLEDLRGYAAPHALTMTLPASATGKRLLLLTGWTDYAFSADNVAATQRGLTMAPPSLQVRDGQGGWRTLIADIGFPAGRPQTVTVDLSDRLPPTATDIRIVTSMRVYWDRAAVGELSAGAEPRITRMPAARAELRWRGFSAEGSPDRLDPLSYDYERVSVVSPWKLLPGRYTREGDVRTLLTGADDMFVVSRTGDEVALEFDASALPDVPAGWTRTFLLHADGFSKEMNIHSSSPDVVAPLPFHGMSAYPYPAAERYPDDEAHRRYEDRFNTRIVARPLPPIETIGIDARPAAASQAGRRR